MTKELTLLICNHNHGLFLPRMLKDIFDQTLDPSRWKVLIVHDGCYDGSERIFVAEWNRLCVNNGKSQDWLEYNALVREKKEGLAACKNFGLKYVDTPYVAYQDCDDLMLSQRLEIQLSFLNDHPEISVCATQAWDRDAHGRLFINCFKIGQYQYHDQIERQISQENVICHGSVMMRMDSLKDVGGYDESERWKGQEDFYLWRKMIASGKKFYTIPERLYIWSMNTSVER